jgi:hypothetical protein
VAMREQQRADQVNVDVGETGGEARWGHQLWKRCIHIKSVGNTVFQARQAKASMYNIYT